MFKKLHKTLLLIFVEGIALLALAWFEENFIEFISNLQWDIANYKFPEFADKMINRIFGDSWFFAKRTMKAFLADYYLLMAMLMISTIGFSVLFLYKNRKKKLYISFVPFVLAVVFVFAQIKMPLIKYDKPTGDGSYFSAIIDDFRHEWYSGILNGLDEPGLYSYKAEKNETIYRIVNPSRSYYCVRIHLDHSTKTGIMYFKFYGRTLTEENLYDYTIRERFERVFELNTKQYRQIQSIMSFHKFWQTKAIIEYGGCDGSSWIVEGLENNKYHIVDRWSPEYGNVSKIIEFFINLAFKELDKYETDKDYIIYG